MGPRLMPGRWSQGFPPRTGHKFARRLTSPSVGARLKHLPMGRCGLITDPHLPDAKTSNPATSLRVGVHGKTQRH